MAKMDCATLADLAKKYQPLLKYDELERWFPALAEAWLSHCSPEDWGATGAKKRGTAIMKSMIESRALSSEDVLGGCADAGGSNIQLKQDDTNANAIGNSAYTTHADDEDLFLNFAGWENTNAYNQGSIDYLAQIFSELGATMNPGVVSAVPLSNVKPTPSFNGVPQPTQPTVFAEVDWAGMFAEVDELFGKEKGSQDLGYQAKDLLQNYLAVTYHLFYPATEMPPDPTLSGHTVLSREGQWEAISLFFRGDPGNTTDGRPADFHFDNPSYVVYSQGYRMADDTPLDRAEVRPWVIDTAKFDPSQFGVDKDGMHPIAYVTAGSHKNLFKPHVGTTNTSSAPNPALLAAGAALLVAAAVVAIFCETPPCWIVAGAMAVIGLLLLLLAFLFQSETSSTQNPLPAGEEKDYARGEGPAATPSDSGGSVPPGSSGAVEFVLRVIDQFQLAKPSTVYPPDSTCEYPAWWDFAGRWGVKIVGYSANTWDSGSRRVDKYGRSRAFWNAYSLIDFWANNPEFQP